MATNLFVSAAVGSLALAGLFGSIDGSGKIQEEPREVKDFHGVQVSHGIRAVVTIGPKTSVKLKGDDNLLALIHLEVRNGMLTTVVDSHGGFRPTENIVLTVVTPKLTSVGASGGSSITAEATPDSQFEAEGSGGASIAVKGIRSDTVKVESSGGSRITLAGNTKNIEIEMSGGANIKAEDLPADSLKVRGSGGSRAYVKIASRVNGGLSGGSTVHLTGQPSERTVHTSGGGELIVHK